MPLFVHTMYLCRRILQNILLTNINQVAPGLHKNEEKVQKLERQKLFPCPKNIDIEKHFQANYQLCFGTCFVLVQGRNQLPQYAIGLSITHNIIHLIPMFYLSFGLTFRLSFHLSTTLYVYSLQLFALAFRYHHHMKNSQTTTLINKKRILSQ